MKNKHITSNKSGMYTIRFRNGHKTKLAVPPGKHWLHGMTVNNNNLRGAVAVSLFVNNTATITITVPAGGRAAVKGMVLMVADDQTENRVAARGERYRNSDIDCEVLFVWE